MCERCVWWMCVGQVMPGVTTCPGHTLPDTSNISVHICLHSEQQPTTHLDSDHHHHQDAPQWEETEWRLSEGLTIRSILCCWVNLWKHRIFQLYYLFIKTFGFNLSWVHFQYLHHLIRLWWWIECLQQHIIRLSFGKLYMFLGQKLE